ncbi:MAG: helical backbone metal receptor, partial [bacterium]
SYIHLFCLRHVLCPFCSFCLFCSFRLLCLFCLFCLFFFAGNPPRTAFCTSVNFPFQLVDATHEKVSFSSYPTRIISLAPSITECLFSLHLDKEIIGVTTYCDYPQEAKKKEKIGSLLALDTEKIFALKPELVLATMEGNRVEEVQRLRRLGLKVFILSPVKELEHVYRDLRIMGRLTGREDEARGIISAIRLKIRETEQTLALIKKRPRCFLQLGINPLVTAGESTLIHDLIRLAGGENLASENKGYIRYSLEEVIAKDPEIILMVGMGETLGGYRALWDKFPLLKARKTGKILPINPDLVDRASPRISDGLRCLAEALHPEAFAPPSAPGKQ